MNRTEIIDSFRVQNPEITDRVISDAQLAVWCEEGDKEVCARTRCIVADEIWDAVEDTDSYDLTVHISKFYDIDEYPGGGVSYDDSRLVKTTIAELDQLTPSWRTADSGTPKKYYRRGKYLHFNKPTDGTSEIHVYAVLISDDFDSDNKTPYNQLTYLEPFHPALVRYLTMRAKAKVGKPQDAKQAETEYQTYINWMKTELSGGKRGPIYFQPKI